MTRRPPFFMGPSLKRTVTIELNAFTTQVPGAIVATTSLAPVLPRSASKSLGVVLTNGLVASMRARPFHGGRPRSASSTSARARRAGHSRGLRPPRPWRRTLRA